jgi:hypothetical protein
MNSPKQAIISVKDANTIAKTLEIDTLLLTKRPISYPTGGHFQNLPEPF